MNTAAKEPQALQYEHTATATRPSRAKLYLEVMYAEGRGVPQDYVPALGL